MQGILFNYVSQKRQRLQLTSIHDVNKQFENDGGLFRLGITAFKYPSVVCHLLKVFFSKIFLFPTLFFFFSMFFFPTRVCFSKECLLRSFFSPTFSLSYFSVLLSSFFFLCSVSSMLVLYYGAEAVRSTMILSLLQSEEEYFAKFIPPSHSLESNIML